MSSTRLPLHGKVAMVTGAAKRIGREIALALGRSGADVIVNYKHSRAEALATVREIQNCGVRSVALQADVSRPAQIRALFRNAEQRFGRLDILVNNAAVFFPVSWNNLAEKDWNRILGTNLKGTFFCAQAAAFVMARHGGGHIINISSLGGIQAWPGYMHYCVSKAGVIMLTRCLAKALAPRIRVNSVAPGTILFPGEKRTGAMRAILRSTPLRTAGNGGDVAEAVLFLATRADFVTGQTIVVDGGKSA